MKSRTICAKCKKEIKGGQSWGQVAETGKIYHLGCLPEYNRKSRRK